MRVVQRGSLKELTWLLNDGRVVGPQGCLLHLLDDVIAELRHCFLQLRGGVGLELSLHTKRQSLSHEYEASVLQRSHGELLLKIWLQLDLLSIT
jgi:hypothetical protein